MSHAKPDSPLQKGFDPLEGIVTTLKNRYPKGGKPLFQQAVNIDGLVELANSSAEPAQFFAEMLQQCVAFPSLIHAVLWKSSDLSTWVMAGEKPQLVGSDQTFAAQRQGLLQRIAIEQQPQIHQFDDQRSSLSAEAVPATARRLFGPILYFGQTVGILECTIVAHEPEIPDDMRQFVTWVCDLASKFLMHVEVRKLRQNLTMSQRFERFINEMTNASDLAACGSIFVNDGRVLAECDRISLLVLHGRSMEVCSVSGLETIARRASAIRAIERIGELSIHLKNPVWYSTAADHDDSIAGHSLIKNLRDYLQEQRSTAVGVFPISERNRDGAEPKNIAIVVLDQYQPVSDFPEWQGRCEAVLQRSQSTLRSAYELSEFTSSTLWSAGQGLRRLRNGNLGIITVATVVCIVLILCIIPTRFTLLSSGELWPASRREVFASTSGIVDRVLVSHADEVVQGQPLVVLRDPELEIDLPRLFGEIATTTERLRGVQTARLIENPLAEVGSRSRLLTADEEELKQHLQWLERQKELLDERRAALTLKSPIPGKILTWEVARHLSARPVERGQSLLSVGETSGPWIVEARVSDRDVGHVLRAAQTQPTGVSVDIMLTSNPDRPIRGQVLEIAPTTEIDEHNRAYVRVVVSADLPDTLRSYRPGSAVIAKIHCGSRSIGYIWFRDLIDAMKLRFVL